MLMMRPYLCSIMCQWKSASRGSARTFTMRDQPRFQSALLPWVPRSSRGDPDHSPCKSPARSGRFGLDFANSLGRTLVAAVRARQAGVDCAYRKLHPAVSRQMSHCYFPVAFLTQAQVPFLHVIDFKGIRCGWDLRDTQSLGPISMPTTSFSSGFLPTWCEPADSPKKN